MTKKLLDVEDLMVWAAAELARKRPAKTVPPPVLDVGRTDRELVGKWSRPMGYPPMSPMFAGGFAHSGGARGDPPHPDALVVEAALERLKWASPSCRHGDGELAFGFGFVLDTQKALQAALANAANLAMVYARLERRPIGRSADPAPVPKLAANGKPGVWRRERWVEPTFGDHVAAEREVEVAVKPMRKGLYPVGSYGIVELRPDPQEIVDERAEYAGWLAGLDWLARDLCGRMESRAVVAPRAALRPWRGESDAPAVRDLYGPGADRVYSGDEAATLKAERAARRRRPVVGGSVYGFSPEGRGRGEQEA